MKKIIFEKENKRYTISKYLVKLFPNLNYNYIFKALRNKDIRVNEKKVNKDLLLNENDVLEIFIPDNILFGIPKDILIEYEDENILVAYKPAGILSNETEKKREDSLKYPTFLELVQNIRTEFDLKICHRLDRNTEGLLIFSKNERTYNGILNGFKSGYINKEYIAYVFNLNFEKKNDILKAFLLKDSKNSLAKIYTKQIDGSVEIKTEYTVLEKYDELDIAKLNVKIHTGKTHQIRAHLSYIGHPIVGDGKYGINELNKRLRFKKQLLYAYKYSFMFPKESPLNYLNKIIVSSKIKDVFKQTI